MWYSPTGPISDGRTEFGSVDDAGRWPGVMDALRLSSAAGIAGACSAAVSGIEGGIGSSSGPPWARAAVVNAQIESRTPAPSGSVILIARSPERKAAERKYTTLDP